MCTRTVRPSIRVCRLLSSLHPPLTPPPSPGRPSVSPIPGREVHDAERRGATLTPSRRNPLLTPRRRTDRAGSVMFPPLPALGADHGEDTGADSTPVCCQARHLPPPPIPLPSRQPVRSPAHTRPAQHPRLRHRHRHLGVGHGRDVPLSTGSRRRPEPNTADMVGGSLPPPVSTLADSFSGYSQMCRLHSPSAPHPTQFN